MKRVTVMRMLKRRLAESKSIKKYNDTLADMSEVYGDEYHYYKQRERTAKNMNTDIEQLEYLIRCLKDKNNCIN